MMGHADPAAAAEARLAALKAELKITSAQESAWQMFTDKARQQAEGMRARRAAMGQAMSTPLSAPDRLAYRTEMMRSALASREVMNVAVHDLYAILTPEQKALADQRLARGMMGGGPFHGRGMRG